MVQAGDGAGRVVRVEGRIHEVPGEGGADSDIRRFAIPNFTHHDDIRILPDDMPETRGEIEADLRIHENLVDPIHLVFDRVFDGDDLLVGLVDALERGIERGGFAAAGGAGD